MTLLHCRQAVGHARVGERSRAERSLARAETTYDRASGRPEAWLAFLTTAELAGLAGAAHQALGRHRRAQELTTSALELLEPRFERNRGPATRDRPTPTRIGSSRLLTADAAHGGRDDRVP
ncbi:hypothetical protein SSOG_04856 [Streptomyces himastatinicus ATCC 53653]|uniref:Tetratricopeptide repeat protein n=1 Tax=Streptomyces himastatinicus ATCC 53653 TaxID=457427 RepID=D9WD80_9ACTN|nr:hypothetical protein SSOG_04856 [Streptomyces himastatinicus ATCC 53653]